MKSALRLLCSTAHPDDESFGLGGTLARYAAEGIETYLVTATRGEDGWPGDPAEHPGEAALSAIREAELRAAAAVLGVRQVSILGYPDGKLAQVDPNSAVTRLADEIRRVRPQVVVTFGPDGATGHPDHIATAQFTTAAIIQAASSGFRSPNGEPTHQVAKLYYWIETSATVEAFEAVFGRLSLTVDGEERRWPGWPAWALSTRFDTRKHWRRIWRAITCHRSQLPGLEALRCLPAARHEQLWGPQGFYRAFSLVNGGCEVEDDLFAGLR